jgi:hypothetical protein
VIAVSYIRTPCSDVPDDAAHRRRTWLELARRRFREFHAGLPTVVIRAAGRRTIPDVLVQLGTLRAVVYTADRGDGGARQYIHFMENEPLLTCDPEGTQLYIVGGRYRVTRRGIEG